MGNAIEVPGSGFRVPGSCLAPRPSPLAPARQRGAALAVGLVFLLVLTIFGVSSLSTTLLEEKMSANVQEQNRAFQSAELGVTRKYLNIIETVGDPLALGQKVFCDADTTLETRPKCTVTELGESTGGSRGGGAFQGNDLTPSDISDPSNYLNRGAAQAYGSESFHYRITSEAVNAAKAKATVALGVAVTRPGTE